MVITGFSGAGKSQAMACFEDAGYFCVDNLPPEMIGQLADLFAHEGSKVEQAAVVCDSAAASTSRRWSRCSTSSRSAGVQHRVLFLEAAEPRADRPLQGDAPPASARARAARCSAGHPRGARAARAAARARRHHDRHERPVGVAAAQGRRRQDAAARERRQAGRHVHELRLQARPAARRRPATSTSASCPTRTTSPTCAR